ncbi:MAG: hypothetical protein BMS9Abin10_0416 [Gammaproteobacteria bacterium]|nr:MAG: hypothetical protein BMS9Abin10_0416 [Gammaproteobacteria bacterium]
MSDTATVSEITVPMVPDFGTLARDRLESMLAASEQVLEGQRVLHKGGLNIVGELLRGAETFYEYNHYPDSDVFDVDTHAQYYYHAHPGRPGEHGHFHTFLRRPGMPPGVEPVPYDGTEEWPQGDEALSHLIAISMDPYGLPIGLFATNRWVTAEVWYPADDVIRMLDSFVIDHAFPSWPVNLWVSAMCRLFRPQIEALLRQRDEIVADWAIAHPGVDVFEDRGLEVTGQLDISVERQIAMVRTALGYNERV